MKAHISEQEQQINKAIEDNFAKVRRVALAAGANAVTKVIYDITQEPGSPEDRLDKIITFCRTGLGLDKEIKNDN